MKLERRGLSHRVAHNPTQQEDDVLSQRKSFEIPKSLVWRSYKEVKRSRGAPGVDGETLQAFEIKRDKNLYEIWNRLCSGSYFPPPVKEKRIPKDNGQERVLGIPTVSDRIAQGAVKLFMEERLDPLFHKDSYGYRPNKSAHQALQKCMERCWQRSWVLEIDISAFLDTVRRDLIIKALEYHQMPNWVALYCLRWMKGPMQVNAISEIEQRTVGTPQGGVISPLLANLCLHYAFDRWMERNHRYTQFERCADDIVCHCSRMSDANKLKEQVAKRFSELGLSINESKSKVVYIDTFARRNVETCFTLLGYDFKVRTLKNRKGELYRKCMPSASKKAMRKITQTITSWKIHRSTADNIKVSSLRHNATLRGWIEYYGKYWYRNFSYRLWSVF